MGIIANTPDPKRAHFTMASDSGESGVRTTFISAAMSTALDNPVWHALRGPQASWAIAATHAARFMPEAAPFFAIDGATKDAYDDAARILDGAPEARFFRPAAEPAPSGWRKTFEKPILQMVLPADVPLALEVPRLCALGADDAPEMLALAERTKPGPFGPKTHALGAFIGIRRGGQLIAMAGERFRLPGYVEISAVAVDPSQRGRGYGRALTSALAAGIRAQGSVPLLHVFPDNTAALTLYESIGFRTRTELTIVWLARAGA